MSFMLPVHYSLTSPNKRRLIREQYIQQQKGLCYWCNEPLEGPAARHITSKKINWSLFPPQFLKHPVHLQHDHITDLTEGAVHAICNAVMWQYHGK